MSETEAIVGEPLPALAPVEIGPKSHTVVMTWAEGTRVGRTDAIDIAPILFAYKVLRPLRDDPRLFASVHVAEFGEAVEWGEDDDLAVSATTLELPVGEAMSNAEFAAFMKRHGLSLDAVAAHLGISRRLAAYYARDRGIPRHIALAYRYLDLGLPSTGPAASRSEAGPGHV